MDEQNGEYALQFAPLGINWTANNASGLVGEGDANQHYIMSQGTSNVIHQINQMPVPITQLMHCLQTPQTYGELLNESGYPEIQNEMYYNNFAQVSSLGPEDSSQMEQFMRSHNEGLSGNKFTDVEHQFAAVSSKFPVDSRWKRSREKSYAADRCRRLKISQRLDALQDLFPHSKEGSKAALLDDVIDHVQYLQHQVKELSQSRLIGESSSNSFIFLEGNDHFLVHDHMVSGPLQDMLGKLLEFDPSAATELLKSKGLVVMPMDFAEGLRDPLQMLHDIQDAETGSFLLSK